jgi:hypothetical protein
MLRIFASSAIVLLSVVASAQAPQPASGESLPSEAGMYVETKVGFTKILGQIVTFERSGSVLASKLTAGVKAAHKNVQLLGPHAETSVDGKPVFYFIPAKLEADAGGNAGDLVLIRLEEKPERRQFEVGAAGAWRASSGISITHQIQLSRSEVKPGIYKVTPYATLGQGEYALYLQRGQELAPYVYDFSVSSNVASHSHSSTTAANQTRMETQENTAPVTVAPVPVQSTQPAAASSDYAQPQSAAAEQKPASRNNVVFSSEESLGEQAKQVKYAKQHAACLKLAADNPDIVCK